MSAKTVRRALGAGMLFALALMSGGRAHAQAPASSVEAVPVQGLSFGPLLPGVAETVRVADAARRAEVILDGSGMVDVTLVLPTALVSPSGARIPLRFGARDAAILRNASSAFIPMNPLETARVRLHDGTPGPARVVLGGTALPAADQPAGSYQATVTVIVNNPGT